MSFSKYNTEQDELLITFDKAEKNVNGRNPYDETYKSYRDYTCIYFFEDGLQLWCVKSLSRFIEL